MADNQGSTAESPTAEDPSISNASAQEPEQGHAPAPEQDAKRDGEGSAASPAAAGDTPANDQDPVAAAIERLSKPVDEEQKQDNPPATPEPPADAAKPEDKDAQPPAPTAKPADQAGKDPVAEWSPEERAHTKGKVKERFRELDRRFKALEQEAAALREDARHGKGFRELAERHGVRQDLDSLTDEQVAHAARTQAAAVRAVTAIQAGKQPAEADLAHLAALRQGLDAVDRVLGRSAAAPAGVVEELATAISKAEESFDFDALKAMVEKMRGAAPAATGTPTATPASAPAPARPPSAPAEKGQDADQRAAALQTQALLARSGIAPKQQREHLERNLTPIIERNLAADHPRLNPDQVWDRMRPEERHRLIAEAHAEYLASRPPSPASAPTAPRQPKSAPMQAGGARPSPQAGGDPVLDAINRLSRK
jgi:hypothetical protein